MICPERKSIEPIALLVGDGQVSALQKFINVAPWDHDDVQAEIQERLRRGIGPHRRQPSRGLVGVVDESGFAKKGDHSAGVDRQYNGRLGKEDNCQVGVFLVGVTPGGAALLDHQLYLPESWCEDNEGWPGTPSQGPYPRECRLPDQARDRRRDLIRRTAVLGTVSLDWITADEEYGRNGDFLDELEARWSKPYVVEVPVNTTVWTEDPASCVPALQRSGRVPTSPSRESVSSVAHRRILSWPTGRGRGCVSAREPRAAGLRVRRGAGLGGAPRRSRVPDLACWCGGRWRRVPEIKYYVSNGEQETPLGGAGPGGVHAAQGRGVLSRTPRATWGWRSTRRGRGSAGTIT